MAMIIDPISPVAFSVFGFDIRWYALAYIAAFILGFCLFRRLVSDNKNVISSEKQLDDLFTAVVLGVIIGGRLGYVLFYNLQFFLHHPVDILALWKGGMSFHGGILGVLIAVMLFSKSIERKEKTKNKSGNWNWLKRSFGILDAIAVVAPIGLFFGRIANFINMEVMGRMTNRSWGIVFNGHGPSIPRHPSPLYEAGMEGILLFIIMFSLWKFTKFSKNPGMLSGIFAMMYAVFRIVCEQFRAPDAQIGFLTSWGLTMGQLLSGLMFIAGAAIFAVAIKKK